MAKASVKLVCNVCGRTFVAEKDCYSRKEADNWESWVKKIGSTCRECWAKEAKERSQSTEKSEQQEEVDEIEKWEAYVGDIMSKLEGTERQIAWARKIRYDILGLTLGKSDIKPIMYFPDYEREAINTGITRELIEKYREPLEYIHSIVLPLIAEKSAKWWIDNKDMKRYSAGYILKNWDEIKKRKERIANLQSQKPKRPECLNNIFAKFSKTVSWNGKVYGNNKYGFRIYIDKKEFTLSQEEADALKKYIEAKSAWQEEYDTLKKEDVI